MKKSLKVSSIAILCICSMSACQNKTETGALTGGAIGAAAGAIIDGGGAGGVLLGGALGAIAGGLVGHSMDEQQEKKLKEQSPETSERVHKNMKLTVSDVIALIQAGVSNVIIEEQITKSQSTFQLSASDIIQLKESGADEELINFMINQQN